MNDDVESMRPHFERLMSVKDEEDQGLTQQGMADRLNEEGVLSLTGQPWSKYSVRRILKKLELQTEASISQAKNQPPPSSRGGRRVSGGEHALKEDSPLRQWSYYESIRGELEEMTKSPSSHEELAQALNKKKVATLDGKPWDMESVARALRTLNPVTGSFEAEDEEIRTRIRQGFYDTPTEKFVAVPLDSKKKKAKGKTEKKDKKKKKGKKKKG